MVVYLSTMALGLTWKNFGADGGDLIAAAATGGIAHPTGYPLYLLMARLFQFLPFGSLAFRTNLMSGLAAALAAVFVYALVTRSLSPSKGHQYWIAGLAGGVAFGFAPLLWSQAIITEVYTLHSLFVALILYLTIRPLSVNFTRVRQDILLGLIFGLAMGNHLTTILLLPVALFSSILTKSHPEKGENWIAGWHLDGHSFMRRLLWIGIGSLIYLTLPVRAWSQPPVNWGNPVTLENFIWLISGKLYQRLLLDVTLPSVWERVRMVATLCLDQFGIVGFSASLCGLIVFFKPTRLNLSMLWIVVVSLAFVLGYASADSFLYLLPVYLCLSVWIGVGLGRLMDVVSQRFPKPVFLMGLFLILVFALQAWKTWPQVDASHDNRAESFGNAVLSLAPPKAIVFAKGDQAIFTMWYFEYALRIRPDLAILATDLLQFKWYYQTLQFTYPDLNLPGPFPFSETVVLANPSRPICYIQYDQAPMINCLPAKDSH